MAHPMKGKADNSKAAKRSSIGVTTSQGDHYKGAGQRTLASPDKASGKPAGGFKAGEGPSVKGEKPKARLDRPGKKFAAGGNTGGDKGSNFNWQSNRGGDDDPGKPPAKPVAAPSAGAAAGAAGDDEGTTATPYGGANGFANGGNVGKTKAKKGGTVVNVIVAPSKPAAPPMLPPPGAAPMPPQAMAPHPPMPPAGMPPQGGPPMVPPGMPMRKDGGRVGKEHKYPKITAGSGSGLGRLQEAKAYGGNAKGEAGKK